MSMGIVSDSDFDSELEKFNKNGNGRASVVTIERGRGNQNEVPESLRKIIGENAIVEGSKETKELTRAFGISDSSLSAYKVGATSTAAYNKPTFSSHINKVKARITKKAQSRLIKSLDSITDDKLLTEGPKELSAIAKDMSVIIKNMEPEKEVDSNNDRKPLVIFAPVFMKEEQFETITIQE